MINLPFKKITLISVDRLLWKGAVVEAESQVRKLLQETRKEMKVVVAEMKSKDPRYMLVLEWCEGLRCEGKKELSRIRFRHLLRRQTREVISGKQDSKFYLGHVV